MFHRLGSVILPVLLTLIFFASNVQGQSGFKSEEELIRAAEKYFNEKNYEKAFPLFSQVVSNRPDNSHYNYCLGVCIMEVAPDKAEAVRFLELATKSPQNPNDSWLYLGKAYHSSYKYDEAISAFQSYKLNAGRSAWNNANGEALIQMCKNGIDVKNDLSLQRHRILEKSETAASDFYLLYKNIPEAGRFLKLPKEYEDKSTKGAHESAYVFLPSTGNTLVYSNASKNNGKGYDIFRVIKDQKGLWMFPEMLSDIINSSGDEAFPVIVNDGKTLYFSSKGSRSTGGYDIFRSDLDLSTSAWSEPVPMGSPINSPGDDFYYVPSVDNKFAYFSSNRESSAGKCDVYKVSIINETRNFIAISGLFNCKSGLELSEAKVTIMNPDDRSIVAQFRTPSQDGNYNLKLPVPSTFIYQVELAGFNSQEQLVDLSGYASTKIIQEIYLVRTDEAKEKMTITNRIPVEDNVVAGNKSTFNPSITQNVGDRDMALATTHNRNAAVATPQSKSDVDSDGEAQTTTPVADQNINAKSKESSQENSPSQTKVTAADNSSSSSSTVSPTKTGTVNEKNNSSANSKPASTTNTETAELVTIENSASPAGSENKSVNENEKPGNKNAVAANGGTENSTVNTKKENITPVSGSVSTGSTANAVPTKNSSDSEKSNSTKVAESKTPGTDIKSGEGISQNQESANTNSKSEELVTASATLVAPIGNESSDKNSNAELKKNSTQSEKSSSKTPASTKSETEVNNESNRKNNSDTAVNANSSTTSSSENSNSTIGTTPTSIVETTPGGNNNLSQGSSKNANENSATETLSAGSGNENKTSNPMMSENGSTSSTTNEKTASTETKKSTENSKSQTVSSTSKEQSSTSTSSELVSGNEKPVATTSENRNSAASNPNSSATSSSNSELNAATKSNSSDVPSANKELDAVSKSNSSPVATSERNAGTNTSEKSNSNASGAKVSQPAGQTTPVTNSSPVSTANTTTTVPDMEAEKEVASSIQQQKSTNPATSTSSQSDPATTKNSTQSASALPTGDPSIKAETQADGNSNVTTSTPEKTENNQTASSEMNQSQNSSPEAEKGSGNEVASSGKSEKRAGIFGSRSKKKDQEVAPVNDAIPEFTTTQPAVAEMPEPPKNLIFRVQLGAYKDRSADDLKKKYSELGLTDLIYVKNDDGLLLVMTGSEKSYDSAITLKSAMIEKGIVDAFIVAYADGSRLPLESVVQIAE